MSSFRRQPRSTINNQTSSPAGGGHEVPPPPPIRKTSSLLRQPGHQQLREVSTTGSKTYANHDDCPSSRTSSSTIPRNNHHNQSINSSSLSRLSAGRNSFGRGTVVTLRKPPKFNLDCLSENLGFRVEGPRVKSPPGQDTAIRTSSPTSPVLEVSTPTFSTFRSSSPASPTQQPPSHVSPTLSTSYQPLKTSYRQQEVSPTQTTSLSRPGKSSPALTMTTRSPIRTADVLTSLSYADACTSFSESYYSVLPSSSASLPVQQSVSKPPIVNGVQEQMDYLDNLLSYIQTELSNIPGDVEVAQEVEEDVQEESPCPSQPSSPSPLSCLERIKDDDQVDLSQGVTSSPSVKPDDRHHHHQHNQAYHHLHQIDEKKQDHPIKVDDKDKLSQEMVDSPSSPSPSSTSPPSHHDHHHHHHHRMDGRDKSNSLDDSTDTVMDDETGLSTDFSSTDDQHRLSKDKTSEDNLDMSIEDEDMDEGIQCSPGDQLVSVNQLTVFEVESFIKKYRKTDLITDEGRDSILYLPDFINYVMEFLVRHGLKKEGIFRRSGVKSRIDLLFETSTNLDMTTTSTKDDTTKNMNTSSMTNRSSGQQLPVLEEAGVYDIADFLKGWFRKQDALLTMATVASIKPLIGSDCPDLNALRAHFLVTPNRLALETLLRFLFKFASKSDYNNMSATNLAIVWTPSVCKEGLIHANGFPNTSITSGASHASLMESISSFMKDSRNIIEFLILNVDLVFSIPKIDLDSLNANSFPRNLCTNASSLGPAIPAIGCRVTRLMKASPHHVFMKIVLERVKWDPLLTSIIDEGGTQKIRYSFSKFTPSSPSIRIQRTYNTSSAPDPTDVTIKIHEESIDDSKTYSCDWTISKISRTNDMSEVSEVTLSFYCDLKGRPFIWYKKSYPRLLEVYLDRISQDFPKINGIDEADVAKSATSTDPFKCCFWMK